MGSPSVLVVDDDLSVLDIVQKMLARESIECTSVGDSRKVLELVKQRRSKFDLAILDVDMPGLNGLELMAQLKRVQPNLAILMMSGHSELRRNIVTEIRNIDLPFIRKPFSYEAFGKAIENALDLS